MATQTTEKATPFIIPLTPPRPKRPRDPNTFLVRDTRAFKDTTGRKLFFELLRTARWLKSERRNPIVNRAYMIGMMRVMLNHYEDFGIADSMKDIWKGKNSGVYIEGIGG